MAQLHHRHGMQEALRIRFDLQLVCAALGGAREDLEHRGGGRLQRFCGRLSVHEPGKEERPP